MEKKVDGYWGSLTQTQENTYKKFILQIQKENKEKWKYDLLKFDHYDFLRFLRARKFDLDKTLEMFGKYVEWRKSFDVDTVFLYKFPELPNLKLVYPHGYHKTDKMGRPVYIERLGQVTLDELFKRTTKERLIRYYVREFEKLWLVVHQSCSQVAGRKIETNTNIIDMTGGSSSLMTPSMYKFVKIATSICQDYYPEMMSMMFIVNTSWMLRTAWFIIKGFMDSKTVAKIQLLGGGFEPELLKHIDAENLPTFLGGKCECKPHGCLINCPGPWKKYIDGFPKDNKPEDLTPPSLPPKFP